MGVSQLRQLTSKGIQGNSNQAKLPWETQHPENTAAQKRKVRIRPIQTNTSFNFDVEFNNLTEWELGLLSYGLRPDKDFRHKLGMGKPIGLGTIRIDINQLELIDRNKRYRTDRLEKERYNSQQNLSIDTLKETFIETMQADIYQALKLIGNPDNVKHPVHYPQVTRHDIEDKSYQWFVANDTGSGQGANKNAPGNKTLQTLKDDTSSIPALQRYEWNG